MTLKQLRDDVIARFGVDHEISNAQIDTWINEGYGLVTGAIVDAFEEYFADSESISLTATPEYTPTKEFLSVRYLELDFGDGSGYHRAEPISISDLDSSTTIPTRSIYTTIRPAYYFWGSKISILPTPTTGTMKVYGLVTPDKLEDDNDIPHFPSPFHSLLVTWAMACMLEAADANYTDAQRKRQEFEVNLEKMIILISDRNGDQAKRITVKDLY